MRHLYLHVPFCVKRCAYCDFTTYATPRGSARMGEYVVALLRLLGEARECGLVDGLDTAYLGGGTPSYLGAEALGRLLAGVGELLGSGAELSFEANPDSLADDVLAEARSAGATRVSIGVQSLDDAELALLGRVHTAAQARERVEAAVDSGLDVSADLMCALPGQTDMVFGRSLEQLVGCGVGHVSVYPLMVEEGTPLAARVDAGELDEPDEDDEADRMLQAAAYLDARGFSRYEVASYALPGKACRHNQAYWTGKSYLGLGTAAASMLSAGEYACLRAAAPSLPDLPPEGARVRLTCASSPDEVGAASGLADLAWDVEFLNAREAAAEDLMLGTRMSAGAAAAVVRRAREAIGAARVDAAIRDVVGRGLAMQGEDGALAPTARGWLLGNELYGALWDLARG